MRIGFGADESYFENEIQKQNFINCPVSGDDDKQIWIKIYPKFIGILCAICLNYN